MHALCLSWLLRTFVHFVYERDPPFSFALTLSAIFNIMHQAISSHGMLFDMKAQDLLKETGQIESTQSTQLGI